MTASNWSAHELAAGGLEIEREARAASRYRARVLGSPETVVLGDILGRAEWRLELLSGGAEALQRRVAGAHTVEVEAPTRWLDRDWVMLTTGVRLRGNAEGQRALVAELTEAGVAALGFGVDLVYKRVPPALCEAARERGFPVFAVPFDTPFREIVSFVNGSLLSGELRLHQRVASLQRHLVDAFREPDPAGAMVARLAAFLDATVLVLGPGGAVERATGDAPVDELMRQIEERPSTVSELEEGGWRAVAVPFGRHDGTPGRWLVVGRGSGALGRLARPAAQAAAPLLAAAGHVAGAARDHERALRAALLDELLRPIAPKDARALASRAASFGLDLSEPVRTIVVRPAGGAVAAAVDGLERALAAGTTAHLMVLRGSAALALAQGPPAPCREQLERLAGAHPGLAIGVGRPVESLTAVHHSLRDAELAAARAAGEANGGLVDFEDFDVVTLLVAEADPERLLPKVDELLAPLEKHPGLGEALVAYLEHNQDVQRTAAALHLHPNSLRYRIARVEQLLGRSLKEPLTIAALTVALIARRADGLAGERAQADGG